MHAEGRGAAYDLDVVDPAHRYDSGGGIDLPDGPDDGETVHHRHHHVGEDQSDSTLVHVVLR